MPKVVLPDQAAFPAVPLDQVEFFKEDLNPENPFIEKWLYGGKDVTGSLPSHLMPGNDQRELWNRSPTLKGSKRLVKPQATNIGNYSPYLIKVRNW